MTMNIVVLDAAELPEGAEFPFLKAPKFGWKEYPRLAMENIAEECWRSDVIVSFGTPLPSEAMNQLPRLKLVICAGERDDLVDSGAAESAGIVIQHVPYPSENQAAICQIIADLIDNFIVSYREE